MGLGIAYYFSTGFQKMSFNALPFSDENSVVLDILTSTDHEHLLVDVGAGEIHDLSNSRFFLEQGWRGVLFDINAGKSSVALETIHRHKYSATYSVAPLTPENICDFFRAHGVSTDFSFLSIDIDSFDFYLVRRILSQFRPRVLIVEINERIPPWIDYELLYNTSYLGTDLTLFSSASISRASKILQCFDYVPLRLLYNNLVAVPRWIAPERIMSPMELWHQGFVCRDWKGLMPWNIPFEQLWTLSPKEASRVILESLRSYNLDAFVSINDSDAPLA